MSVFKVFDGKLQWSYDREKLLIEPWGNGLRVRCTKNNQFEANEWALLPSQAKSFVSVEDDRAVIECGKIRAVVENNGHISFENQDGKLLFREFLRTDNASGESRSLLKIPARQFKAGEGDSYGLTVRFEARRDEKLFGMGQYQQDILNLKGAVLELAQRNSQASVPFVLSDAGYGFLWNNPAIGQVIFGTNQTQWQALSTKQMDYWVTAGDSPAEIMSHYSEVTGKPPMMPEYAMGYWQCKLRYKTQEELLEAARGYYDRNIPLSVIVIDYFHWPNQGTWDFDRKYWPDPKAMVEELKSMGVELMVSVWPTVDSRCENYEEMLEKGYLAGTDRGVRTQMQFLGNETFFDATNDEARAYVWEKVKKNYYDLGIHTFWLDVAEPEYSTYDFELYRYTIGSNLQVGNIYPMMYAKGFYDGMISEGDERPLNLIRCAWAGSQRYGTLVWSGDIHSSFSSMRSQIAAGLNMAVAGIPWWTTDIGGFNDGDIHDPDFIELLIRWFQYAAFCPVMRMHGYRLPYEEPMSEEVGGGMCDSGAANEVWSFGEEAYEIFVHYIRIRENLRPYIREMMAEAHEKGVPPMRPMFYDFPEQKEMWDIEDQYMFGSHILAAPILYKDMRRRSVYLPKGRTWLEVRTGKIYEGGQNVEVDAPLDYMPLFTDSTQLGEWCK